MATRITLNTVQKGVLRRIYKAFTVFKGKDNGIAPQTIRALMNKGLICERSVPAGIVLTLTNFGEAWAGIDRVLTRTRDELVEAENKCNEERAKDPKSAAMRDASAHLSFVIGQKVAYEHALRCMAVEID